MTPQLLILFIFMDPIGQNVASNVGLHLVIERSQMVQQEIERSQMVRQEIERSQMVQQEIRLTEED